MEAQPPQLLQPLRFDGQLVEAFQHVKRHEGHPALSTVLGFQKPDRPGGQVASVFVGLAIAVHQGVLQHLKIAGADERLSRHHQPSLVGDLGRDAGDAPDIVGDDLALVPVTPGGRLADHAAFVGHLEGEPVQLA